MEHLVAVMVVVIALLAALALGWRQWTAWRWLRAHEAGLSQEDTKYYRWSLGRRITGCVLLLVLGGMIWGLYVFNIAAGLEQLKNQGEQAHGSGQRLSEEQLAFVYGSMRYVGVLLIVLLLLFVLAAWDVQAIRRFGRRHRQRIRDDRRAMLERQLPILYAERRAKRQPQDPSENGSSEP
jgi:hypothetical protein